MLVRVVAVVLVLALAGGVAYYITDQDKLVCDLCDRHLHAENTFKLHLSSGETLDACCPRCGLRYQQENTDVAFSEVADFQTGEFVDADAAYFIEGSTAHSCAEDLGQRDATGSLYTMVWDRCLPSLIAFKEKALAEEFILENGGEIRTYAQLLSEDL
jgi:hypothetical protein